MKPDEHNLRAWEKESSEGANWSSIVSAETMESVRRGDFRFSMCPDERPIPDEWLGPLEKVELLCLAGGGGQQGPILAGLGANVTVYDFSSNQLSLDRLAAEKYGLEINTAQGDMRDLSRFPDESFNLVVHPASNMFVDNILPVWSECYRVLRIRSERISGRLLGKGPLCKSRQKVSAVSGHLFGETRLGAQRKAVTSGSAEKRRVSIVVLPKKTPDWLQRSIVSEALR